jgi:hypothetical protein
MTEMGVASRAIRLGNPVIVIWWMSILGFSHFFSVISIKRNQWRQQQKILPRRPSVDSCSFSWILDRFRRDAIFSYCWSRNRSSIQLNEEESTEGHRGKSLSCDNNHFHEKKNIPTYENSLRSKAFRKMHQNSKNYLSIHCSLCLNGEK